MLDRCDKPITLLKKIKKSLIKDGLLIVALVLPFKPYVEYNRGNKPSENLFDMSTARSETCVQPIEPITNGTASNGNNTCSHMNKINQEINILVDTVFKPLGFELVKFSKIPYLCEGNLAQSFYFLIDYLFVFKSV